MDAIDPGENFDVAKLKRELECHLDFHNVADSTNDIGLILAQSQTPLPAVVLAEQQVAGRGQPGKTWQANKGSLTLSIVMRQLPEKTVGGMFPLLVGLRVCEALEPFQLEPMLKWPNDIFFGRKKAGGILVETTHRDAETVVVIGIGLNVNNRLEKIPLPPSESTDNRSVPNTDPPPSFRSGFAPTSLSMECGRPLNLTEVASSVARHILNIDAASTNVASWTKTIFDRLVFRDKVVHLRQPNGDHVSGKCTGIAEDGGLQMDVNGRTLQIYSGSIVDF